MRKRIIELLVGLGVALAVLAPRLAPAQSPVLPGSLTAAAAPGQQNIFKPYSVNGGGQNPLDVYCVSGCSGGGSSGAVFGPTAAGSAAANPPVIVGGTVDGSATGNVDNWKVSGGIGYVNCANCSGSGVSQTDEAAFTAGTSLFAPGGGFYQTTATSNPLTNGQQGLWQMTANRAGFVNVRNSSGAELGLTAAPFIVSGPGTAGTAASSVMTVQGISGGTNLPVSQATAANLNATVVGTGTFAVQATLQASATTAIGKVDPNTIASWGLMSGTTPGTAPTNTLITGGIYNSSTPSPSNGQTLPLQLTSAGSLHTTVDNTNANGQATAANSSPTVLPLTQQFGGATGSAVPSYASYSAGDAQSSEPSAATTGNLTGAFYDLAGKQVTSPYANRENMLRCAVTITASTAATTCTGMSAQGASVKIYITGLCITRSDAGTTADVVTLNDGATSIYDVPNNGGGGGICPPLPVPLVVAANTAFQATSGTSITSLHVTAQGFKGY